MNEEEVQPGPMTEIDFWEAKLMNLESIFEQMKCDTTKKMGSILQITDRYLFQYYASEIQLNYLNINSDYNWLNGTLSLFSAYFPCFRSMFRNVVAALNEAQDITLYLKPLKQHFKVYLNILK